MHFEQPPAFIQVADFSDRMSISDGFDSKFGGPYRGQTRVEFTEVRVGDCNYKAVRPMVGLYEPPMFDRPGRFFVSELAPEIMGRGKTLDLARKNWKLSLDAAIQGLLSKVDFELDVDDRKLLEKLQIFFDWNQVRYSEPLKTMTYGTLEKRRGEKLGVRWIDGSFTTLRRHQIPANMVGFKVGQPFDAVLLRDPRSNVILKIESVFPAKELPILTTLQADEIFGVRKDRCEFKELDWD